MNGGRSTLDQRRNPPLERKIPSIFGVRMPLDGEKRVKEINRWSDTSHDTKDQKTYYKPKGVWSNGTKGQTIKIEDVKDEGINGKS